MERYLRWKGAEEDGKITDEETDQEGLSDWLEAQKPTGTNKDFFLPLFKDASKPETNPYLLIFILRKKSLSSRLKIEISTNKVLSSSIHS